jgi:hypothetical protein
MERIRQVIFLVGFVSVQALAAGGAGTSGGALLNIGVGARAIAMGEAYTAQADDVSSLYWNPAGIALLNQSQASFMYNQFIRDLTYHNAAVAVPLENGGLGASVSYLSYGPIQGFDDQGNTTGDVNAYSGVGTLGGALLGDFWAAGFNLKAIQTALADVSATGFAADAGATLVYPKEVLGGTMRAGMTVRNLGTGLKFIDQKDPFPRQWRVGVAAVQMMRRKLNLSLDYGQEREMSGAVYGGAEYWVIPNVALRAGYSGADAEGNGLRAGLGLKFRDLSFDYAFSDYGDLGLSHRYEVSMRFGEIRSTLTPEMRRMFRQAKAAIAAGRYGEATLLLDSLIAMGPNYKPFRRYVKIAMTQYEANHMVEAKKYVPALSSGKTHADERVELQDLEMLLNLSDEPVAKVNMKKPAELTETNR